MLLELKISGEKVVTTYFKLHFEEWINVECQGLSGGIWSFKKSPTVSLHVIGSNPQYINYSIDDDGSNN